MKTETLWQELSGANKQIKIEVRGDKKHNKTEQSKEIKHMYGKTKKKGFQKNPHTPNSDLRCSSEGVMRQMQCVCFLVRGTLILRHIKICGVENCPFKARIKLHVSEWVLFEVVHSGVETEC